MTDKQPGQAGVNPRPKEKAEGDSNTKTSAAPQDTDWYLTYGGYNGSLFASYWDIA